VANCSNCGRYMDGFGSTCGVCKDNAQIQKNQSDMQRQLESSAREAQWAAEESLREVRAASYQASRHHDEAMQAESDRLEELQKQTQILLEGQITNEEAYQRGFDLEDEYLDLLLTEDGRVYWEIYEPYLVARLNAAYEKGAQDRLQKEFESDFPGLEYVKQEAFGHGYAGSRNCSIVYLHHLPHIYPAKLNALSETGLTQTTNQETGKLEWQWMPAYMSEELNDAYDAGAQKFLGEQNTAELVAERLEKDKAELRKAEESAKEQAEADLKKQQSNKSTRNTINLVIGCIVLVAMGFVAYMYFADQFQPIKDISKLQKVGEGVPRDKFESSIKKDGWVIYRSYREPHLNTLVEYRDYRNASLSDKVRHVTYDGCNPNRPKVNTKICKSKPAFYEEAIKDEILPKREADEKYKFPPLVNVIYIDIGPNLSEQEALDVVQKIKASDAIANSPKKLEMSVYKQTNWDEKDTNLITVWEFKDKSEAKKYLPLFAPYGDVYMGFHDD